MEKDFDYKHQPTHQLLDHEKLETTIVTHFLWAPMRLHDFLQAGHPLLKMYYANFPSKIEMIQNKKVWNHLGSFDDMVQLPNLHLQLDNQWHSEATTLDMKSFEQCFHCCQDFSDQDLSTVDF